MKQKIPRITDGKTEAFVVCEQSLKGQDREPSPVLCYCVAERCGYACH